MKHRKLRIAWSVAWGLVAVLLCVLWVRSYSGWDYFVKGDLWTLPRNFVSRKGTIIAIWEKDGEFPPGAFVGRMSYDPKSKRWQKPRFQFDNPFGKRPKYWRVPHWFLIVLSSAIAAVPWLRFCFSLRTLLIATTLVALVLGLVVWASRTS